MKNFKIIVLVSLIISSILFSSSERLMRQCRNTNGKTTNCNVNSNSRMMPKKDIKDTRRNKNYIGIDRARAIALSRVKGANSSHVRKLKLDYDDGRPVYEGEIRYKGWEYEFEIDAVTGRVLEWEKDKD